MSWVRLDDLFPDSPKLVEVGAEGLALQVHALCWSARYLTDGQISQSQALIMAQRCSRKPKALIEKILAVGLWERAADGYLVHDYLEYNPSREQVLAARAATKQRVDAWRKRGMSNAVTNAVTGGVTNGVSNASPQPQPRPLPVLEVASSSEEDRENRLKPLLEDVLRLWTSYQGWGSGWPQRRLVDRDLIAKWVFDKGYPLEFWEYEIARLPKGVVSFNYLAKPAPDGGVCRLEEDYIAWREKGRQQAKMDEAQLSPTLASLVSLIPSKSMQESA